MDKSLKLNKYGFSSSIQSFLLTSSFFYRYNKALVIPVVIYITALIACIDSSCLKAASEISSVSHDTLLNMLSAITYEPGGIIMTLRPMMPAQTWAHGWLIIDDVILHKDYSTKTAYVFKIKDHTNNEYVYGIQVVVLLWSNGLIKIPVGYRIYSDKKHAQEYGIPFKTKIELAIELLDSPVVKLLPVDYVAFDSWYPARALLKHILSKHMHYVCIIKKNRKLRLPGETEYKRTDCICKSFNPEQYRFYEKYGFYMRGTEAILKDVGEVKLVIVKNGYKASINKTRFIVTDMINLSVPRILSLYLNRWDIEVFFRDTKQLLSFEKFRYRGRDNINGHISLVFISYIFLDIVRAKQGLKTIGDAKSFLAKVSSIQIEDDLYYVYVLQNSQVIMHNAYDKNAVTTIVFGDQCFE